MRAFVVLSFVVCLAVAKPQYDGYNYQPPTAYQTSGLQQQQQYSLSATAAAAAPQTQYTQPQSYASYPAQNQYYQSYPTVAAPLQQTAYAGPEQSVLTSTAPLQRTAYASADQAQLQQAAYATASPSPLDQSSFSNVGQAHLQQAAYATASPSPFEQTSYAGAGQAQYDQTQFQQSVYPTASPLEQTAGAQLPLSLPTAASYETQGGFQPSQTFLPQQEPSPATTFNGLTGFNAQQQAYQSTAYANAAAYDQSQFYNLGQSYANNANFAQLQQYSAPQLAAQEDNTSGTLNSFHIESTFGPNPADIAPAALVQQQQPQQPQQQQFEAQSDVQFSTQGATFAAHEQQQPQEQLQYQPAPTPPPQQQQEQYQVQQQEQFQVQQQEQFQAQHQEQFQVQQQEQFQAQHQEQFQVQQQEQFQAQQQGEVAPQPQQPSPPQEAPNQSQNVLPLEQIAPEHVESRQQQQQGPLTTIQKHIYVHVPPPGFEDEEEPLPAPFTSENKKRYNIIFIKSPNVVRPRLIQQQQSEDKTIVYVLVKKPDDITQLAQPEIRQSKPEVFFIKYKAQTEQTPIEAVQQVAIEQHQPQQTEDHLNQEIVVEDRSKQPSQAPQFPALEGNEAQALLREEEEKQQREEQQEQLQQAPQQQVLQAPLPSRTPVNAGISPLPIDLAHTASSPAPPTHDYLPPRHQQ